MVRVPSRTSFEVIPGGGGLPQVRSPQMGPDVVAGQASQMGAVLGGVSDAVFQKAQEQQEKINRARVQESMLLFREDLAEAQREYSALKGAELVSGEKPVLSDLETRLEKRRSEILGGLNSDDAKYAFEAASKELFSEYRLKATEYQAQQADAYVEQQRDGIIIASIETSMTDPKKRAESMRSAYDLLTEKFQDQGFSDERLEQMTKSAIEKMLVANIDTLVSSGNLQMATDYLEDAGEYISPFTRQIFREQIAETSIVPKSIEIVDGFTDRNLSSKQISEEIRKISDPKLRMAVEKRRDYVEAKQEQERSKAKRAEEEYQVSLFEKYGDPIRRGEMSVNDIPPRDFTAMTQAQISGLESIEKSLLSGKAKFQTDLNAIVAFNDLYTAGDFTGAKKYLSENADKFEHSDWQKYYEKASPKPGTETENKIKTIRSLSSEINRAMDTVKIKSDKARADMIDTAEVWYKDYQITNGRTPTNEEVRKFIEESVLKIKIKKPGPDVSGKIYRFGSSDNMNVEGIPPEHIQSVLRAFTDAKEVDHSVVQQYYNAAIQELQTEGLPVTPLNIQGAIMYLRNEASKKTARQNEFFRSFEPQ